MTKLKGFQKRYLRGLAHKLNPAISIGQKGLTDTVIKSMNSALDSNELVKVKFTDFKEKAQKQEIGSALEKKADCEIAGMIGHTALFFRQQDDPEKRKISLPERKD
ncbi:YhbY family RNA-binding protein [Thermodesulfobacteriota bacterium]